MAKKPVEPVGAATEPVKHAHTWRTSYGPDGTPVLVCDCGAQKGTA